MSIDEDRAQPNPLSTFLQTFHHRKIWNRVDCQRSEKKKILMHKRLKERFFIGRNRTKRANFLFPAASFPRPTKISWINCFSIFMLYVAWKKEDFLEKLHVLSCFVQLKSVLLIACVFWIFSLQNSLWQTFHKLSRPLPLFSSKIWHSYSPTYLSFITCYTCAPSTVLFRCRSIGTWWLQFVSASEGSYLASHSRSCGTDRFTVWQKSQKFQRPQLKHSFSTYFQGLEMAAHFPQILKGLQRP